MYLKKLDIQGFKSFAKKTILEFEPGITSVVGPNGSGKSNIADSLRWVFGEQSMKLLRGKKSEDVIFAGSDQKARLGGAEVSIYFDNADRKIDIDYGEVVISRRVYRDGNSEYLINGNVVRLLDIADLLAKSGFGNTSYYVIGQGMIDQLIARGPGAVKELMEEASGILPYYQKREKTLRKLETTSTNLEQARALLQEIEPRLRSLKRQTSRLEKRADLEKELREKQILYFHNVLSGLIIQNTDIRNKIIEFEKQSLTLTEEIKVLSREMEQQRSDSFQRHEYKKLREELEAFQEQRFQLQEDLAITRGKIKVALTTNFAKQTVDWDHIHVQFKEIYQTILVLFNNFSHDQAMRVQKRFEEILSQIERPITAQPKENPEIKELNHEENRLEKDLEALFIQIHNIQEQLSKYVAEEEDLKRKVFVKERLLRNKQDMLMKVSEQKHSLAVEQARVLTRKETYEKEAGEALGQAYQEVLAEVKNLVVPPGIQEKIIQIKKQLDIIGGVDELVVQEYEETNQRHEYLTAQINDLTKGSNDLKSVIAELDERIKEDFHDAFSKISEKFTEYFRILFGGGKAVLTILREEVDPEGQDSEAIADEDAQEIIKPASKKEITGIDMRVTPPGKKLSSVAALSGGERALTSIAMLCAILASYPSPFVVLDEVDAALDEANSIRFGKILGTLSHKTQFITITHNRETMRQSHTLYGVTMGDDGVSKVLGLKLEQAAIYSTKN